MKLKKQLIFIVTFLTMISAFSDGYCKKIFYDKETLSNKEKVQEIIKRNCYRINQNFYSHVKYEDKNEYKRAVDSESKRCECRASSAYLLWGPKFMDLLLNKGYTYMDALQKVQLDDLYKNINNNLKYEELSQKCFKKYYP